MADYFDEQAELGSEEEEDDLEGDAEDRPRRSNGDQDDSSEEEEDDDDEAAIAAVREGFIADDDDDEIEARRLRRAERKKRKREERQEEEENLDEEDLDLIAEVNPEYAASRRPEKSSAPKFKRLKRGRDHGPSATEPKDDFWSDQEDEPPRRMEDEMAGFIEEDDPMNDAVNEEEEEEDEVTRVARGGIQALRASTNLDEDALEDFQLAFGDGNDYNWALELQEAEDIRGADGEQGDGALKPMELKDVFEPSELERKYLTDHDNEIRIRDEPERYQIGRKPYRNLVLTDDQTSKEPGWIANMMWPKASLPTELRSKYQEAIGNVLNFYNVLELEAPFVFRHRKDYLVHQVKDVPVENPRPDGPQFETKSTKLLTESDLWDIFSFDLKYRAFIERRNGLWGTFEFLTTADPTFNDDTFQTMIKDAQTVDELQDIQDYIHFQWSGRVAEAHGAATNGTKPMRRRPGANKTQFDKVRNSGVYSVVKAFGMSADAFAQNVEAALSGESNPLKNFVEDPADLPEVLAQDPNVLSPPDFTNGPQCMRVARTMFVEELATNPRLRRVLRGQWYRTARFDCIRTEKGLRKIDEQHPYYEFKYLRNQSPRDIASNPGLFLRMIRAEAEGLVTVKCRMEDPEHLKNKLIKEFRSEGVSDVADAWNKERAEAVSAAFAKINKVMERGVKENIKAVCETEVASRVRNAYYDRLDQAPWKPKGEPLGTMAQILAMSNGNGTFGRDPVTYAVIDEDGRWRESATFTDFSLAVPEKNIPEGADVAKFIKVVVDRKPDVIAISGYSTETLKLYRQISKIIQEHDLRAPTSGEDNDDDDDDDDAARRSELLEVVIVNDEVARLYKDSDRGAADYPALTPLARYCVALARYMQNPLLEYASLGKDIMTLNFDPDQRFLTEEKLSMALETAMVDVVSMVGIDINEAAASNYHANLLPYAAGLGVRKAQFLLKAIRNNGGGLVNRDDLINTEQRKEDWIQPLGPKCYTNCASVMKIHFDEDEDDLDADILDSTRIHPEDYDLARKICADSLELDEEDVVQEQNEHGPSAVVRKLFRDGKTDNIHDLVLDEYAEQLANKFHQQKQGALQTIRSELLYPYEELRNVFEDNLRTDEIFTMFTGETKDSLTEGMIVPMLIKKVGDDFIEAKLDCGIDATVEASDISETGQSAKSLFAPMTTVRAKIISIDKRKMQARMSLIENELRQPYRKTVTRMSDEWDEAQEKKDKEKTQVRNDVTGRTQRVINHPLFKPFSSSQAEEYLGSQSIGSVVIRPSSRGTDHLVVTWKVSDGVYKHIDVLELDKENEFSVGRTLKIDGKYTYSDLDELLVNHVTAMARKVDEMTAAEKFQRGSKADTDRWLTTYLEANPKRSTYAFCINNKAPGYFHLCFKESPNSEVREWPVKVVPGAFELQTHKYQDMRGLVNGFKTLYQALQKARQARR